MTKAKQFRNLVERPGATLIPVVHDALTAKIAQNIGFEAISVGGFAIAGVNYGLPDVGLLGLSDMVNAIRPVVNATDLPVFADADGGYGNQRNVALTISEYQKMGVAALFIEDQKHPKRCGHMEGKEVVDMEEMVAKIKAAVGARTDPDFLICARTDTRSTHGLNEAIKRSHAYAAAGADIIFIEAPQSREELELIPKEITEVPLLVNMLEGGKTPLCSKSELEKMGYKLIAHPVTSLFSAVKASQESLKYLKTHGKTKTGDLISFSEYKEIVELNKYL